MELEPAAGSAVAVGEREWEMEWAAEAAG